MALAVGARIPELNSCSPPLKRWATHPATTDKALVVSLLIMPRFAVIGLGRFGTKLAQELTEGGAEVIAVDVDRRLVEAARDEVALALVLDATDEDALRAQGIDKVDCAVVGIGQDFEAAALATAALRSVGVPRVISRAVTEIRGKILTRIGASQVVYPEHESARRWAHRLSLPHLRDYIELGEEHSLVQITTPESFCQKTPAELRLRQRFGVNLVAIKRRVSIQTGSESAPTDTQVISVPAADTTLLENDILILVGSNESLGKLPQR